MSDITLNRQNTNLEEDEIDLKELFSTIWSNKFKIIIFSFVITSLTVAYTLSIPNSYKSSTILVPHTQAKSSLGGLGALAGIAGIDIGSSGSMDPSVSMNTILNDYEFEEYVIKKYNLSEKIKLKKENLVFALGYDEIYNVLNKNEDFTKMIREDEKLFNTYKTITGMIFISSDKKSGAITLSAESQDRFLAKELVDIYLKELTSHLRKIEMQDVQKQIDYYSQELESTVDLSIKDQLGQLVSGLVQKKVLSLANEFYNVKQLTKAQVSYIKDKTKPKRGLMVVVSFVTSIILGIFMVFLIEFLRKEKE